MCRKRCIVTIEVARKRGCEDLLSRHSNTLTDDRNEKMRGNNVAQGHSACVHRIYMFLNHRSHLALSR